jgi:hypothetical protein
VQERKQESNDGASHIEPLRILMQLITPWKKVKFEKYGVFCGKRLFSVYIIVND